MAKKNKFYAVKAGVNTGIFLTWKECQENITGYKNAVYKSFSTQEEAELYLNGIDSIEIHKKQALELDGIVAYIDGSYSKESNRYSFGCVIINKDGKIHSYYAYGDDCVALKLNNVAGELQGSMYVVKWACDNGYKNIIIKHDYEGISKWITGEWKAKDLTVKKYVEFINKYKEKVNIKFEKVSGHSGDKYNEEVDRLAKKALFNGNKINKGQSWITVTDITLEDIEFILDTLKDDTNLNIRMDSNNIGIKMYRLKLEKEEIVIKMFIEQNKLLIQGKFGKISSLLLSYISEVVELDQMNEINNDLFKINIDKQNVATQFEGYFINSKEKIPEKITRVLHQAVYNLNIYAELFDASFLIFPALRALEGFLKFILGKHEINCNNGFNMFAPKDNGTYALIDTYNKNIGSSKKICYLNKLYNFYYKQRHSLFHWNDPLKNYDDTKLIDTCASAHNIIKNTLQLIDEYYTIN
ncbi:MULTISPECIES: viroplasmin family protein [unclassified Clostridium]|uniref:ribonuclease H1 domain-containing protein n=1 Tax=unclassified Clostridium TaxID=2614128 RepID=UPI0025BB619F|nr:MULTISPECIES: viroplasmin family protein [unclassified Clostridium]